MYCVYHHRPNSYSNGPDVISLCVRKVLNVCVCVAQVCVSVAQRVRKAQHSPPPKHILSAVIVFIFAHFL